MTTGCEKMAEKKDRIQDQDIETSGVQPNEATEQSEAAEVEHSAEALDGRTLREALEKAERERDEYLRIAQRTQADFLNYKRVNAAARADSYDEGVRDVLAALLPTIDNLDRALDAAHKAGDDGALTEGVSMTLRQLLEAMEKVGLYEIPALGEVFDPECHNAVVCVPGGEPGTVQEVFQKGYSAKGRNIRCAMVRVAAEAE
jgi:molecular chaperone GrpE